MDVIGRVAVVETRLQEMGGDFAELGGLQDDVHKLVQQLHRKVDQLQTELEAFTAGDDEHDADAEGTAIVDWSELNRPAALREWDRLYQWLDTWLVPTYQIRVNQLRTCWPLHPEIREELSWLRVAWMQVYRRPSSSGSAAGEWHVRWLPAALDRIQGHFTRAGCTAGSHEGTTLPEAARMVDGGELSLMRHWVDDGRVADIEARHP